MRLTVARDQFTEQVTWVAKHVPSSPPVPVLGGIRIEITAATGTATIAAFDYEKAAQADVSVSGADTSEVVVAPAKRIANFVTKLPRRFDSLEVIVDGAHMTVRTLDGASSVRVLTMPAEDYPAPFPTVKSVIGTLPAEDFAAATARLAVAAGTDMTLPVLTGARLRVHDRTLEAFTTDRYRAAAIRLPIDTVDGAASPPTIVVPMTHLSAAGKALKSAGSISVGVEVFDDASPMSQKISRCTFAGGNRSLTFRLPDSDFPQIERFFADSYPAFATVPVRELAEAIHLVVVAAFDSGLDHTIHLNFATDQLTVHASHSDEAQADAVTPASLQHADTFAIAFNAKFLLSALKTLTTPTVRFELATSTKPSLLTEASGDELDTGYQHLLMPVRTQ